MAHKTKLQEDIRRIKGTASKRIQALAAKHRTELESTILQANETAAESALNHSMAVANANDTIRRMEFQHSLEMSAVIDDHEKKMNHAEKIHEGEIAMQHMRSAKVIKLAEKKHKREMTAMKARETKATQAIDNLKQTNEQLSESVTQSNNSIENLKEELDVVQKKCQRDLMVQRSTLFKTQKLHTKEVVRLENKVRITEKSKE